MMNAPVMAPPPPTPATTLPKIRIELLGATAHIVLPSSKTRTVSKNVVLSGKYLYCPPFCLLALVRLRGVNAD